MVSSQDRLPLHSSSPWFLDKTGFPNTRPGHGLLRKLASLLLVLSMVSWQNWLPFYSSCPWSLDKTGFPSTRSVHWSLDKTRLPYASVLILLGNIIACEKTSMSAQTSVIIQILNSPFIVICNRKPYFLQKRTVYFYIIPIFTKSVLPRKGPCDQICVPASVYKQLTDQLPVIALHGSLNDLSIASIRLTCRGNRVLH